jgi:iron complex transport system substrate-binding protein
MAQDINKLGLTRRNFVQVAGAAAVALAGAGILGVNTGRAETASDAAAETQVVTDMAGNEVTVPTNITKFADAWYAHNEVSIMLTNDEGIVATHCSEENYPWMYRVCPNISGATATFGDDFNYEDLVALNPQVVFDSKEDMRDKLTELGIPLVNCSFKTYEEMEQSVTLTAQVFGGDAVAIAEKYVAELEQTVADVKAKTDELSDDDRPSVLHGASVYTFTLDGTGTIIDTWINAAGGKNANTESTTGNAQAEFSLEQIIEWNPDVIITGKPEEVDQILNDESWASITAVQNGAVYVNPKGVFGWDRYGVEELLQVQWAAALLHPELFPDLQIEDKVKAFYKDYLRYDLTDAEVEAILGAQNPPEDAGTVITEDSASADSAATTDAKSDSTATTDAKDSSAASSK